MCNFFFIIFVLFDCSTDVEEDVEDVAYLEDCDEEGDTDEDDF